VGRARGVAEVIKVWGEGTEGLWSFGQTIDVPEGYIEVAPGDAYITRRIKQLADVVYVRMEKKKSLGLSVPVGLLAPEAVVEEALSDAERTEAERAKKRAKSEVYRKQKEQRFKADVAARVRALFPGMPKAVAEQVVAHAFEVGSGRVGRTTKIPDELKIELAVKAHIRHSRTNYDILLAKGWDRDDARERVWEKVERIYRQWQEGPFDKESPG
jgi:hypothetical protein